MIRTDRLRQLADHLMHGKLGHEQFDFSQINNAENTCGTLGCAIGEMPIVWPEEFRFMMNDFLHKTVLNMKTGEDGFQAAEDWFEISEGQSEHLFCPNSQATGLFGGKRLNSTATRHEVAANITAFCDKVEKGEVE